MAGEIGFYAYLPPSQLDETKKRPVAPIRSLETLPNASCCIQTPVPCLLPTEIRIQGHILTSYLHMTFNTGM